MKNSTDKKKIIANFSKAARSYDKYADIQKAAACELACRLPDKGFKRILEIGCGTGIYTALLNDKFKNAVLKSIDISPEMISVAKEKFKERRIDFEVADAEVFDPCGDFDLVTSNACFQWFHDLGVSLRKYKDKLAKDGVFSFSMFGPKTYWEFNSILSDFYKGSSFQSDEFITKDILFKLLNKYFKAVTVDEVRFCESLPDLKTLLSKIRNTGTNGRGLNGKFIGSKRLKAIEAGFKEKFGAIKTTHQVFFCYCHNS
ncbi:MAG TPA: methyltransferase domain-containing protein [Candidatus Omnitrophota bacterium]|nr:methyltransferase domain-containing protein [Candidatus Omnitrophota bacterium]